MKPAPFALCSRIMERTLFVLVLGILAFPVSGAAQAAGDQDRHDLVPRVEDRAPGGEELLDAGLRGLR